MTLEEVALQLGKKPQTIYKNFRRTQDTLRKKGIILSRWGRGDEAEYEIEYDESILEQYEEEGAN